MKKNMEKASSKTSNKVSSKSNNNVTNSNSQSNNIGFDKTQDSKSFHYDENSDHSFELRDCK